MISPNAWQRLAAAARRAPDECDISAPYGFAARVAAQAMSAERRPVSIFEQFSLKLSLSVMGATCLLALAATGASYPTIVRLFSDHVSPAVAYSSAIPAVIPAPVESSAVGLPASDVAPAATPSSSDDPVAELVDIVS